MEPFVLWSLKVWPARGLNNFISAASVLRLCEANPVVPKFLSADPKGSSTISQGIRGYISVMVALKVIIFLFLIKGIMLCQK